jgi:hypothetical protein
MFLPELLTLYMMPQLKMLVLEPQIRDQNLLLMVQYKFSKILVQVVDLFLEQNQTMLIVGILIMIHQMCLEFLERMMQLLQMVLYIWQSVPPVLYLLQDSLVIVLY